MANSSSWSIGLEDRITLLCTFYTKICRRVTHLAWLTKLVLQCLTRGGILTKTGFITKWAHILDDLSNSYVCVRRGYKCWCCIYYFCSIVYDIYIRNVTVGSNNGNTASVSSFNARSHSTKIWISTWPGAGNLRRGIYNNDVNNIIVVSERVSKQHLTHVLQWPLLFG